VGRQYATEASCCRVVLQIVYSRRGGSPAGNGETTLKRAIGEPTQDAATNAAPSDKPGHCASTSILVHSLLGCHWRLRGQLSADLALLDSDHTAGYTMLLS
jgi:hypothetical protein